jgi:hypothetical protein
MNRISVRKTTLFVMKRILIIAFSACVWAVSPVILHAQPSNETQTPPLIVQKRFTSPEEAVKALQAAAKANDQAALNDIFGPEVKELLTGDKVQDAKNAKNFDALMDQGYTLVKESDSQFTVEVGTDSWPMPIPLVKANGQWVFDTAAGKEEIINRHIGKDELHAIGVCHTYVTAQERYAKTHPDASQGVRYAQAFNEISPLNSWLRVQPFHGYYFRILTRQGREATGGEMNYRVHGNLTKGYALVAYPEHWDQSGIMTFIVNQDGKVYQRNFAEQTSRIGRAMEEYNPGSEWALVQDEGVLIAGSENAGRIP